MKTLKYAATMTDIHWGAKNDSQVHNDDCMRYIDWFCKQVEDNPKVDHIMFLGDWYTNRSAVNILTLNQSYEGAKKLNALGLPVFFIVGNHDLYRRNTRETTSVHPYSEFSNFVIINDITVVEDIGEDGALVCPYMFHDEYVNLKQFSHLSTWWGHFEFKGFVITGETIKMKKGPNPTDFAGPKKIFSGHFHKRQKQRNIQYIGNTFPQNFSDVGDSKRGLMFYDHGTDKPKFVNWDECPMYLRCALSDLLDDASKVGLLVGARVECSADVPISFEEKTLIQQKFTQDYELREFTIVDSYELHAALTGTDVDDMDIDLDLEEGELLGTSELVVLMLEKIETDHLSNDILVSVYKGLDVQ